MKNKVFRGKKILEAAKSTGEIAENRMTNICSEITDGCIKAKQRIEAHEYLGKSMKGAFLRLITNVEEQVKKDQLTILRASNSGFASEPDDRFIPNLNKRSQASESIKRGISQIEEINLLLEEKKSSVDTYIRMLGKYLDDGIKLRDELVREYEHERAVEQSQKILEWTKELQTCEASRRPEVLADLLLATCVFPEEVCGDMRASEKLARMIRTEVPMSIKDQRISSPVTRYVVKDLERGGPVARLVNREQKFREARGLILPISLNKLREIYNKEYQNIHGADKSINDLRGFLQAVKELDIKLQGGTIGDKELSSTAVKIRTGITRAPYSEDLPGILDEIGFPENGGTFVGFGSLGWDALGVKRKMDEARKSFSAMHTFDICTKKEASNPEVLRNWESPGHRELYTATDEDRQELEQINRHYEFDLTQDKLTGRLNARELREPILYTADNFLLYYGRKWIISMLKRLFDIPEALGQEPASLLHVSYGFNHNPSAMKNLLINLTTGHLLRAGDRKWTLKLRETNVRGSEDQPFQVNEDELVRIIKKKRKAVMHRREQFSAMSDEDFERLRKEYGLETGKW